MASERRISIHDLWRMKQRGRKIAMVTCYDYTTARILDEIGFHVLLVGDSVGMVVFGHDSTLRVDLDMMLPHCQAVIRGSKRALVVMDLPFATYSGSDLSLSLATARRAMAEGRAQAVKIEGGRRMAPVVGALVASGIPVMCHIGLTPQSIHLIGGHRVQGRGKEAAERLIKAAHAHEEAGAFAIVLECVPAPLAAIISKELTIPTIGIGAGVQCDGQVQVVHDIMGQFEDFQPKHAKRYADVAGVMRGAAKQYFDEVLAGTFPGPEHSFDVDELLEREDGGAHPPR